MKPRRIKLAIVDDNADNRLILRTYLEDRYEIAEFADGKEAIQGVKQMKPDVVLLDISLPDMDGVEVLRVIRDDASLRDLRVIALTAHAMIGDRERFLQFGFDAYASKPLDFGKLEEQIRKYAHHQALSAS
ncbi:MAG TPA: response regulator [Terriglobia bacterium]|jgi:CheY-like chemotaxis protein